MPFPRLDVCSMFLKYQNSLTPTARIPVTARLQVYRKSNAALAMTAASRLRQKLGYETQVLKFFSSSNQLTQTSVLIKQIIEHVNTICGDCYLSYLERLKWAALLAHKYSE